MATDAVDIQALTQRVERLERQNRRLKAAGIAVLASFGAVLLMGQAAPAPKIIAAQEFILKDRQGRPRITISGRDQPAIRISDERGVTRSIITADRFDFVTGNGTPSVELLSAASGPELVMFGADGKERASLGTVGRGSGLMLFGPDGLIAGMDASGNVSEVVLDRPGSVLGAGLYASSDGPELELDDPNGFETDIGVTKLATPTTGETHHTSVASIVMFGNGKEHKVIWQAPGNGNP